MTPIRVLLTTDVIGGVWDFCVTLAAEVVAHGGEVVLLALGEPSPDQTRLVGHLGAQLITKPLRLEWMQDSQPDVQATRELLARLVNEVRPDVVHANQFAAACTSVPTVLTLHSDVLSWRKWTLGSWPPARPARAPRRAGSCGDVVSWAEARPARAPSGTASFGDVAKFGQPPASLGDVGEMAQSPATPEGAEKAFAGEWCEPAEWQPYAALVRYALGRADAVVAVSEFLASEVRELYGTRREIEVIPNGWRASTATRGPRQRQTLLAGRIWDAAKNIGLALQRVPTGARVLLAGEQRHPETGGLADLPAGVEALGFVPIQQLERLMSESRIYLSAARYDPFGLLPLQAALAGCALLLSDIPSYQEVWADAAVFFQPDELRDRWQRLLDDDKECTRLAAKARQRALERYSAATMAERYLAVYARVAAGVAV